MGAAHQHDDLELNLVAEGGAAPHVFAGVSIGVGPGSITAFWAAAPHRLVADEATRVRRWTCTRSPGSCSATGSGRG